MRLQGNWNYPTSIRFGAGRVTELPEACTMLGIHRPLLVSDRLLGASTLMQTVQALCEAGSLPVTLFSDVQGNPVAANVESGVAAFRDGGHDGVIAIGGGSALDAGKAIALMVGQNRPIWDFEDREDWFTRVDVRGMAPVVAVPTAAGTGSEVGRSSVITDTRDQTKKIIFHPRMMPGMVIADPALTVGLPAPVTAATGMDALSHCLEAFCVPSFHPIADGVAVEGMRLVHDWLPRAVADGTDLEARAHMLVASTMGAAAFQKGLGAMHSLSHPCGAHLDTHHGLTNAVVMPYVLCWNRSALEEKCVRLARWLDLPRPGFDAVLDWVLDLRERIGIPHTLAALGVQAEHVERLAASALTDPSTAGNPLPMTEADFSELYRRAIEGRLQR